VSWGAGDKEAFLPVAVKAELCSGFRRLPVGFSVSEAEVDIIDPDEYEKVRENDERHRRHRFVDMAFEC
jgi:hypothetical protein